MKMKSCTRLLCHLLLMTTPVSYSQSGGSPVEAQAQQLAHQYPKATDFRKALYYYRMENWDSVLVYSMKQLDGHSSQTMRSFCHYFRGTGFRNKQLIARAEKEFGSISTDFQLYPYVQVHLAEIYLENQQFERALHVYQKLEPLLTDGHIQVDNSAFWHNMGLCHFHLQQYPEAEKLLLKAVATQQTVNDLNGQVASLMDLGNLYYAQYRDRQALFYFTKAYTLSQHTHNSALKQNAALNMAVVYENARKPDLALHYRKEYELWHDSLNDQNKIWSLAELEKKFAVSQKQKQVDILQARNKLKAAERNTFLFSSVLLILLLGVLIYFYRQKVTRSAIIQEQKNALDQLNATKDKLFSIVSHDLRSSVRALKSSNASLFTMLENHDYVQLVQQLRLNGAIAESTFNLLDNLLHWALLQTQQLHFQPETHSLYRLSEQVVYNYLPLMDEKHITFSNRIPKNVSVFADAESVKLMLRNFLDNAIKFTPDHGSISLYSLPSENGHSLFIIEDSGSGMSAQTRQELLSDHNLLSRKAHEESIGTGLGLQLCKSMIRKNNGTFFIESTEGSGTKMIVSLPAKSSKHG